jgi:queuine tRNA-ribosyltransferase
MNYLRKVIYYLYYTYIYLINIISNKFNFIIYKKKDKMRLGFITTPHGIIKTPAFIFCGTKATMKSTTTEYMEKNNTQIILSNTYHLFLKGYQEIKKLGGLHKALNWNKPMLTDSGGYQVFAMNYRSVSVDIKGKRNTSWKPSLLSINDDGAIFRNYYNNQIVKLTPEISIQVQKDLGADFVVVFDECTSSTDDYNKTKQSLERSILWSDKSINEFYNSSNISQALYGIVQGGIYLDLRKQSVDYVNNKPFFGICVGGCLGSSKEEMYKTVEFTMNNLRKDKPVHLLGIGYIEDIFNGVENGIDTFDCVHPSRISRHGCCYLKKKIIKLGQNIYQNNTNTIDNNCKCTTCKNGKGYTTGYLHLLMKMKEPIVYTLITNHNVYFMNKLMEDIRNGILNDNYEQVKYEYINI